MVITTHYTDIDCVNPNPYTKCEDQWSELTREVKRAIEWCSNMALNLWPVRLLPAEDSCNHLKCRLQLEAEGSQCEKVRFVQFCPVMIWLHEHNTETENVGGRIVGCCSIVDVGLTRTCSFIYRVRNKTSQRWTGPSGASSRGRKQTAE